MFVFIIFGLLTICLSSIMVISPQKWSNGIVAFSEKSYFHWFEVISRFIAGVLFIAFHQHTSFPQLMLAIGYLLLAVSLGLIVVGSAKHKEFAVWSASKFKSTFRVAGICSFCFGLFLIYIAKG